jgi:hypothetical protein
MRGGLGGGGRYRPRAAGAGSAGPRSTPASRLDEQRAVVVREAITLALTVMTPAQQAHAKWILSKHDVDLDDDTTPGAGSSE